MNPSPNLKRIQRRTSFENKWVRVIIRGDTMSEHGVIELNGCTELERTNKSSENGIPSKVGLAGELRE